MEDSHKDDAQLAFSFSDEDFMAFLPESEEEQFTTRWSDFNFHDPGVTAYEAMQLSFEDFFYRYDFPIQDLMQGIDRNAFNDWGVDDLYTLYAVTENDYRRVLATRRFIENIAVKPVLKANLNPQTEDLICLLNVDIAASIPIRTSRLVNAWERRLIRDRAVGEYFNRQKGQTTFIRNKKRRVKIRTKLDLHPIGEDRRYYRKISEALEQYLLPNLESINYRMIEKRGRDLSKLFTGPAASDNHQENVINDSLFHQPAYRRFIIVSELFEVLERLSFVRKVNFVQIALQEDDNYEKTVLDLGEYTFTELGELEINGQVQLTELRIQPVNMILNSGEVSSDTNPPNFVDELIVDGKYRDLSNSTSLQTSFPPNYEMGRYLVDQNKEEVAKTSSFRAFLYLMDQVRANISGQMGNFYKIFSVTKELPSFVEADINDEYIYKGIDIPDLSLQNRHDEKKPMKNMKQYQYLAETMEVQDRFTEQRLNYLLALNGWGVGANSSSFWNRKEYTKIKNDFLNLVHDYSAKVSLINTEFNNCFQSKSLVLLQEKLRVILQFDLDAVRILEHLFLQPVWTGERGLNFELTVFLFEKKHPKHNPRKNPEYKKYVQRMIRAMIPAHIVETVKWIPQDDQSGTTKLDLFDAALKQAVPPVGTFYLNSEISDNQRKAMNWLKNDWVQ